MVIPKRNTKKHLGSEVAIHWNITDREGEIILKNIHRSEKLAAFAGMYADSLAKEGQDALCVSGDMDQVVAASGNEERVQ